MSNYRKVKHILKSNLTNIPGWRTDRKIVVIESDDWGSIRMPSPGILREIMNYGLNVEKCHYMMNDSLASEKDLDCLFNLLISIKNDYGNSPVLTANTIIGNPNFEKIRDSDFQSYFYEPFYRTLKRYPEHQNSFDYWKKGMSEGLFHPQFHGREHVHVGRWLKDLRNGVPETLFTFHHNLFGVSTTVTNINRKSYLAAYDSETQEQKRFVHKAIGDGLNKFEVIFGYKSLSNISPNYIWDNEVEKALSEGGVKYLQGARVQRFPLVNKTGKNYVRRCQGEKNKYNQRYLIRNCKFEPSSNASIPWVDKCFQEIKNAFLWKKPAIIDTHRVNYVGYINQKNRENSLKMLQNLLTKVVKRWPDVEFMTSDKLGELMNE